MSKIFQKTWKTETAMMLLAWFVICVGFVVFTDPKGAGARLLEAVQYPLFGFALSAFGLKVYQNKVAHDGDPYGLGQAEPTPAKPDNEERLGD